MTVNPFTQRTCGLCEHVSVHVDKAPCDTCFQVFPHPNFEPKIQEQTVPHEEVNWAGVSLPEHLKNLGAPFKKGDKVEYAYGDNNLGGPKRGEILTVAYASAGRVTVEEYQDWSFVPASFRLAFNLAGAAYTTPKLPVDAAARKAVPLYSGVLKYFPDALAAVAELSRVGNEQHNPGKPLHWDRSKSGDELDALTRHLLEAGTFDTDGIRHSTKAAWRALANLQKELEKAK